MVDTRSVIDADHPWPWLDAYTAEASAFFNGRDDDTAALLRCVLSAPATVFFGKSGLGKTSLVQAGLAPALASRRHFAVLARLRECAHAGDTSQALLKALEAAVAARGLVRTTVAEGPGGRGGPVAALWELLHDREAAYADTEGRAWMPVFVLDQFEEVFTIVAEGEPRESVFNEIGNLVESRLPPEVVRRMEDDEALADRLDPDRTAARFVLALREDYLPDLETWADAVPRLGPNRFRLLPMSRTQAREATLKTGGVLVAPDDAERIIEFLATEQSGRNAVRRGPQAAARKRIEPALLSLVCAGLNQDRLARQPPAACLETRDLATRGRGLLEAFYDDGIAALPAERRDLARRLIEGELITASGTRRPFPHADIGKLGLAERDLATLTDKRLLRVENTEQGDYVELVHDRVAEVAAQRAAQRVAQAERDLAEQRRRQRNRLLVMLMSVMVLPPLIYGLLIQGPANSRIAHIFNAGWIANATPLRNTQAAVGSETRELESLLRAAVFIDQGQHGYDTRTRLNRLLFEALSDVPFVRAQSRLVDQMAKGSEPVVNGSLRDLLQSKVWNGGKSGVVDVVPLTTPAPGKVCTVFQATSEPGPGSAAPGVRASKRTGTLYLAQERVDSGGPAAGRVLFVPEVAVGDEDLDIRVAALDANGNCTSSQRLISIPRALRPMVAFDADLRTLFYKTEEGASTPVSILEIEWQPAGHAYVAHPLELTVLMGHDDAERLVNAIEQRSGNASQPPTLATLEVRGGRQVVAGDSAWLFVLRTAQSLGPTGSAPADVRQDADFPLRPLQPAPAYSNCKLLVERVDRQESERGFRFTTQAYEDPLDPRHCFVVQAGPPEGANGAGQQPRHRLVVNVYARPDRSEPDTQPLLTIARLYRFGWTTSPESIKWWVGKPDRSEFAGWLVASRDSPDGRTRFQGAPWSTCALWRLGSEIYRRQPGLGAETAAPGDSDTCQGR